MARIGQGLLEARLDVGELAGACELPGAELAARFRAAQGCSPEAYVRQRRLEAAALLLGLSTLSIGRIAELVGSSPREFSRAFQQWSKLSPSAYRQRGLRR
ncbi:MAG: helix-turn-helix domain-containing protein [Bosea sp.]|nr:helix-turn-helix domain-containing protein [Bosea sp. (in: a-proteobacteria)]